LTVVSGGLLAERLVQSPRDLWSAATNAGILAAVGYYLTRTTQLLVASGRTGQSLDRLQKEHQETLLQLEQLKKERSDRTAFMQQFRKHGLDL
jgi:hypothetical protein